MALCLLGGKKRKKKGWRRILRSVDEEQKGKKKEYLGLAEAGNFRQLKKMTYKRRIRNVPSLLAETWRQGKLRQRRISFGCVSSLFKAFYALTKRNCGNYLHGNNIFSPNLCLLLPLISTYLIMILNFNMFKPFQ